VVIPTLEALSVEVCPLPTALLSTQTDGYDSYYYEDKTDAMEAVLGHWESLGLSFDAVYSGFLGSPRQVDLVCSFIGRERKKNDMLVVVDPVLGDDGAMYGPVDASLAKEMRKLVACSDLITPNTTEAALLLGRPWKERFSEDEIIGWARDLQAMGPGSVVITSVQVGDRFAVVGCRQEECFLVPYEAIDSTFPGSGDLFASILTGLLIRKVSFRTSVEQAVSLVSSAISRTAQAGCERRHGVSPMQIVGDLVKAGDRYGR
jgi:pyridoxine kinase